MRDVTDQTAGRGSRQMVGLWRVRLISHTAARRGHGHHTRPHWRPHTSLERHHLSKYWLANGRPKTVTYGRKRFADSDSDGLGRIRGFGCGFGIRNNTNYMHRSFGNRKSIRLFVCLSNAWIVTKWTKLLPKFLYCYSMPWPWLLTLDHERLHYIWCDVLKLCTKFECSWTICGWVIDQ